MTREEFISMMGFSDNSPLRNEDSLNIQTGPNGIIDMSNTGMPLMANGRYLPPYSGHHQFDPNSIVTEIPVAQYGASLAKAQRGKSIDDQGYRKWLKDWLDARKKTGRFEDQLNEDDLAKYKNNINSVQQITRDQHEQMFPGIVDNSGGLSYLSSPAGGYTLDLDELGNDNPKQHHYFAEPTYLQMFTNMFDGLDSEGSTKIHELTHAMTRSEGSGPFRKMYPNENWKDYKDLPIQQTIKNIPIGFDEWYDDPTIFDSYEGDPEEILAQLMQYRYNFNVDPNRIFTEDDIKEVMKNVEKQGPAGLFGLDIFQPKEIIRLLNEVVSVEDDLPEGTMRAKYGGSLPKFQGDKDNSEVKPFMDYSKPPYYYPYKEGESTDRYVFSSPNKDEWDLDDAKYFDRLLDEKIAHLKPGFDFMKDWTNSGAHRRMLNKSVDNNPSNFFYKYLGYNPEKSWIMNQERNNNLGNWEDKKFRFYLEPMDETRSNFHTLASQPGNGPMNINGRFIEADNWDSEPEYINKETGEKNYPDYKTYKAARLKWGQAKGWEADGYTYDTVSDHQCGGVGCHEYSHASDASTSTAARWDMYGRLIPEADVELMKNSYSSNYNKDNERHQYLAIPTETRARLNEIRKVANDNNLWDVMNKKPTREQFNKLIEKGNSGLSDLREIHDDDAIFNMLNNVSDASEEIGGDDLPIVKNAKYGGSLPKFQGLSGSETVAMNDKLMNGNVADKYQPVVDWYESYLTNGTFDHLKNKIINNAEGNNKSWTQAFFDAGEEQGLQYINDYPYTMRHADENWDDLDESVIIGPSIEEKYTGSRGQHTHKSGNHTMTRSGITIDPLNDVWGPYTEEQQIGIMAHELGHTDARFFTGDKKLTAEINKKNKSYQKVWNELSEEKKKEFTDNPVAADWWLGDNYGEAGFHDAQPHEVRSDVVRFRYQADKAGIYNSSGDYIKFTEDDLKKMKEEHPNNRLFKNFEDKDIIWLMDNVADATEEINQEIGDYIPPVMNAKYGAELPRFQKKGEYDWDGWKIATEKSIYPDGEYNWYNPADSYRYLTNENETTPIPPPPPEDPESAKNKSEIPLSWDEYKIEKPKGTIEQFRRYIRNPKYKDWRMNKFSPYTNRTKKGWANKEYYRGLDEEGVGEVQEWLIEQGYDIKKDNGWGDQTYNALNNYLLDNKLLNKEITTDPLITDDLLINQQYIESDGKPKAGSNKGALGLVQAMPGAWKDAIKKGILPENADRTNINHSLTFQRYYMNGLMNAEFVTDATSDNEKLARALSAYNWGRGNTPTFFKNINYVATNETIKDKDGKVIESGFRNKLDKEGNPILVPEDERRDPLDMDSWMTILDTDKESTRWTIPKETVDYINLIMYPDKYIEMYGKKQYESRIKSTKKFEDYKKKAKKFYSYKEGGSVNTTKRLIRTYKSGGELSGLAIKHLEEIGIIPQYKGGGTTHTINDEEALLGIAKEYNTTEKDINKYNNLIDTESLYKGQVINIPEPIVRTPLEIKKEAHKLGDYGIFKNMPLDTQIKLYSSYVNGDYMMFSENLGKKLYDKLNRVYYDKARVLNMSILDYMKSILS